MIKHRSFIISASFPSSKSTEDGMRFALEQISPLGIDTVEYYSELSPDKVASLLQGKRSIFLSGARQKAEGLNPCSLDAGVREKAISALAECFKYAKQAGASGIMFASGTRPDSEKDDEQCLDLLFDSITRLHQVEPELPILLEPGDRDVEFKHLLGHTDMSVKFAQRCQDSGLPLKLVFDISHIAELGEDLMDSWKMIKPYCDHVHFANCVLDKSSPLYGDKHPFFNLANGVFSHKEGVDFLSYLKNEKEELMVGLEIICPLDEDEKAHFDRLVKEHSWFFEK